MFSDDPSVVAVVVDERKVQYKDEITSLSAISDRIKGYSTSGPSLFTYKGKQFPRSQKKLSGKMRRSYIWKSNKKIRKY